MRIPSLDLLGPVPVAAVRTAIGLAMLAAPPLVPDLLGADRAATRRSTWLVRMLGAREVALGGGALLAARGGRDALRPHALGGALSDGSDALVMSAALAAGRLGGGPVRTALVVGSAGGAVLAALGQVRWLVRG